MKLTILFRFIQTSLFEVTLQQLHIVKLYCKLETPLGINPLSLVYFCNGVSDDGRTAETCCMVK